MSRLGRKLIRAMTEGQDLFELYKGKKSKWEIFKLMLYINPFFDPYHKVMSFFNIQRERINRLYVYGKHIWRIGEWDYNWHLELQLISLKRLYDIMVNGNGVFSKVRRRKMRTAIALLERLNDPWEHYHEPADKAFCKKWNFTDKGRLLTHPDDIANPPAKGRGTRFYTSRHAFRDSLPADKQIQFDKEYKVVLFIEDVMFKQDMDLFCKIWSRNIKSWWD